MRHLVLVITLGLCPSLALGQVTYERILNADKEPGNWLTYSGNYSSHRYSPLTAITRDNVASLRPVWVFQTGGGGSLETSPIVIDGIMYITQPPGTVLALDGRTGRTLWSWSRPMPEKLLTLGFPRTNRGVAILGETLYYGTLDSHVVALDASSGLLRPRWGGPTGVRVRALLVPRCGSVAGLPPELDLRRLRLRGSAPRRRGAIPAAGVALEARPERRPVDGSGPDGGPSLQRAAGERIVERPAPPARRGRAGGTVSRIPARMSVHENAQSSALRLFLLVLRPAPAHRNTGTERSPARDPGAVTRFPAWVGA